MRGTGKNARPVTSISALALLALGGVFAGACDSTDQDVLRANVEAAGVFSPRRVEIGSEAVVELGRVLFFERELSGNRNISCATCHLPEEHAGDDHRLSIGQGDVRLPRNTAEPFNRSFATNLFWDGRVELVGSEVEAPVALPDGIDTLLEAQALLPLLDRDEMRGDPGDVATDGRANELALFDDEQVEAIWDGVIARIRALPEYEHWFASAFPDVRWEDVSIVQVARALAEFELFLWELTDTRFDSYLGSSIDPPDDGALSNEELRGAELFFGEAGCSNCHNGPLLSDGDYHNIGVIPIGPGHGDHGVDIGRANVSDATSDRFRFRTPPLRNVELTSPFMHNGAYTSLAEAVRQHLDPERSLRGYRSEDLEPEIRELVHTDVAILDEVVDGIDPQLVVVSREQAEEWTGYLVAFLRSLSSQVELEVFPGAGAPFAVPSGLPIDGRREF